MNLRLGAAATPERIARIADAKEELYRDLVRKNGVAPLPGVRLVHRLQEQGWLQALASSAPRANIDVILDVLGTAQLQLTGRLTF
jgi:phosphoglycolate phosphatase-like HAD superfamily hydrolase